MYVRMSTDLQKYSIDNQEEAIREYAARHHLDIVRTYADEGKSGLSLDGREALQALIHDVQTGTRDFAIILVLDVTRWGRFQDADESAHYEFLCRRAGLEVQYVAEQFDNDGSPVSTIVKGVKRAMAAEYSRELSRKTFAGQCRIIEMGFRLGGPAGYGLRRILLDDQGRRRAVMSHGDRKAVQTDRVVLAPGPEAEIEVVRWIYNAYIHEALSIKKITALLNDQGISNEFGRQWNRKGVHTVLTNEKYIGNNIFNRSSQKLATPSVKNPPDIWVRADGVFQAIVEPEVFYTVQRLIRQRNRTFTDDEVLANLKALWRRRGMLSYKLMDKTDGLPSSARICHRFGGLSEVYRLVGYEPRRKISYRSDRLHITCVRPEIIASVVSRMEARGSKIAFDADTLVINSEVRLSVVICRCTQKGSSANRWRIRFDPASRPDITLAVRLAFNNRDILDYYIIPSVDAPTSLIKLKEHSRVGLDSYRFDDLDALISLADRTPINEVAKCLA